MIELAIGVKRMTNYEMLSKALALAIKWHRGAVDKGGNAYIFHPISVSLQLNAVEARVVALLHDIVEDTAVTLADLTEEGFSLDIIQAIDAVTRRVDEPREHYLQRVKLNAIARDVKLADLINNSDLSRIPTPQEKDFERVKKYAEEIEFLTN